MKLAHQRSLGQVSSYTCVVMLHIVCCHACSQTADLLGAERVLQMQALLGYVLLICCMLKARSLLQVYSCLICYSRKANCRLAEKPCLASSALHAWSKCVWLVHVQVACSAPVVLDAAIVRQPNAMERHNSSHGSFMRI